MFLLPQPDAARASQAQATSPPAPLLASGSAGVTREIRTRYTALAYWLRPVRMSLTIFTLAICMQDEASKSYAHIVMKFLEATALRSRPFGSQFSCSVTQLVGVQANNNVVTNDAAVFAKSI